MNKLKLIDFKLYIDGVEIKNVKSFSVKQSEGALPCAKIEFTPEIEIDNTAIIDKKVRKIYDRCGECKHLDLNKHSSIGFLCVHPERKYHNTASYKYLTTKACKKFEKKNCTDCILDGTDACSKGAGRAVDDEICKDFLRGE